MKSVVSVLALLSALCVSAAAQQPPLTPTETVLHFYRNLKEKKYVAGFNLSVYKAAVEGLSESELKELEPEFARTFAQIPDKIDPQGEQINGDTATVLLKFEGSEKAQPVALIRVNGQWLVGDEDSLKQVQSQGRAFFFNTRLEVAQEEAAEMVTRIIGAEYLYEGTKGVYGTFDELIRLGGIPKDMAGGVSGGYRFSLVVSEDLKSYYVTAEPVEYGRTGRLSFYGEKNGVHAEDKKGKPATPDSPMYQTNQ